MISTDRADVGRNAHAARGRARRGSAFVNVAGLSWPHEAASPEPDTIVPGGGAARIIDLDPGNQNNWTPQGAVAGSMARAADAAFPRVLRRVAGPHPMIRLSGLILLPCAAIRAARLCRKLRTIASGSIPHWPFSVLVYSFVTRT